MKVVLIGGVRFSAIMLEQLLNLPIDVVGVCTRSPRKMASDELDLGPIAIQSGIPFKHVGGINDPENLEWIAELKPDLICCFGWSQLLSAGLLRIPPLGVLGFHPAALPANRGRHPIIWALVLGLTDTASTFFFMDDDADSGDIVSQKSVSISGEDGAGTLYEKITSTAVSQIQELIPKLIDGDLLREIQDPSKANYWRKRTLDDGRIDWRMSNTSIHNLVRALTKPYLGAHFDHKGEQVKVWRTELIENHQSNLEPGTVVGVGPQGMTVKTGTGAIQLVEVDPLVGIKVGDYL
ncbi:MAG: formyltransferase family protein [Candidatus Nanopelagicales bacterium]|nr:formyltransferase family protein [Candidatus Nanopelagicales bacterium]